VSSSVLQESTWAVCFYVVPDLVETVPESLSERQQLSFIMMREKKSYPPPPPQAFWEDEVVIELAPRGLRIPSVLLAAANFVERHRALVTKCVLSADRKSYVVFRIPRTGQRDNDRLATQIRYLAEWSSIRAAVGSEDEEE
jgi:hypothetical protein